MKRFKELLIEITMNNPGVMFLLEGNRGHFNLNINTGDMLRHLTTYLPMSLANVDELKENKTHTLETPLTLRYHSSHEKSGEDFLIHKLVLDEKNNISVVNHAGEQVQLNKIEKPSKTYNEGLLHELRISRILKHYGIARRDSIVAGSGDAVDAMGTQKKYTETPTKQINKTQWGDFETGHAESGDSEHQYTVKKEHAFEVKEAPGKVVLSQLTLNYKPEDKKWFIPTSTDPKMDVTSRLLTDRRFAHKNYPNVTLLDTINSGTSNPGFLNIGGIYGSNESHKQIYATPQFNTNGSQKRNVSGKPLFQEIPQHDSLPSTNLAEAQEHLAKKSDFLIVGTHLYTLNPKIHEELKSRKIPSIMLSHPENQKEGTFKLHTRVKSSSSGNVNVSMRFNDDLHDGVQMDHNHLVKLSNGFFNENNKKTYKNEFNDIMKSPA
jgi:hypothetical protein